jgi:hypothetical protein
VTSKRRPAPPARYELVTRQGCHLCDEMASLLDAVLPGHGLAWSPLDVDSDLTLRERFSDVVPVLLRNGKPVAKVRLHRRALERILLGRIETLQARPG